MKTVTITLSLEDDKFNAMEQILLKRHPDKLKNQHAKGEWHEDMWTRFVIESYYSAVPYLNYNGNDLEKAYEDMYYDF